MSQALELLNLTKIYGDHAAVKQVSFTIRPGEVFGLLGPNGAGKTSIVSMISTLEKITSGELKVFGASVQTDPMWTKRQIGVVPQEIITHGFFDLVEILEFQSGYFGLTRNREHIDYLLHKLSLWDHRHKKVKQLSGGMKRRLMIAKALVHSPRLLLLDEPTAGVDIELRESLWTFVRELRNQGTSILLTTHYLEEAENLCERVGIIHKGQIRYLGETQEIIKQLTQRHVQLTLAKDFQLQGISGFLKRQKNTWEFLIPSSMSIGELLTRAQVASQDIIDICVTEGSLEEAFVKVLGVQDAK